MQVGMVGLGRMGGDMVTRLRRKGHEVVAFDESEEAVARAESEGAIGARAMVRLVETR
jgi:6-phosphogluconate dehydrogenase